MEWYSVTDIRVTTGLKMSYWPAALHMQDESSLKQSRQARRKKLKLLDINSDEAIGDTGLPDEEKLEQRALMQYSYPKNHDIVLRALRKAHREDLIGNGPKCLIPWKKPHDVKRRR